MILIEILGTLGALFLALCSVPQVIESIHTGRSNMNVYMLWMWFIGVGFILLYTFLNNSDPILFMNYCASFIFSSIILFYKHFPRN